LRRGSIKAHDAGQAGKDARRGAPGAHVAHLTDQPLDLCAKSGVRELQRVTQQGVKRVTVRRGTRREPSADCREGAVPLASLKALARPNEPLRKKRCKLALFSGVSLPNRLLEQLLEGEGARQVLLQALVHLRASTEDGNQPLTAQVHRGPPTGRGSGPRVLLLLANAWLRPCLRYS